MKPLVHKKYGSEANKISKYKVNNYISGYWEQITKTEPSWKAYQLGLAQGMFQAYQIVQTFESKELADKMFLEICKGKDEYCSILKTLIALENENSEKIDYMMELFNKKYKDKSLTEEEGDLLSAITRYLYESNK